LNGGRVCQIFDGAHVCPTGTQEGDWYTGFTGTETCGACTCGNPAGASCDSMRLTIGSDFTCNGSGTLSSGGRLCFPNGIYQPGLQFVGTPNPGSCPPQSAPSGNLAPTGRRVTFEYVLLAGVNDTDADAARLPRLLRGIPTKVNLIPWNPFAGPAFARPSAERIRTFQERLRAGGLPVYIRTPRGDDIDAACGQLAAREAAAVVPAARLERRA
jgi:hypothetical protein